MASDDLAAFLGELFAKADEQSSGTLHIDTVRDLLFTANLGLSRLQIHACLGRAEVNAEGEVQYAALVSKITKTIRSMLGFQIALEEEVDAEDGEEVLERP